MAGMIHRSDDDPFYRSVRDDQGWLMALGTLEVGPRVMRNVRCACEKWHA